ncbi:hypothetical protein BG004_003797 [Podila humilis]|nr:hypothetical protein BG004_003797 [Podila humilis]
MVIRWNGWCVEKKHLTGFFLAHSTLHTLDVEVNPTDLDIWIPVFEKHERIRSVKLKSSVQWTIHAVERLLRSCKQLCTLSLELEWRPILEDVIVQVEGINSFEVQQDVLALAAVFPQTWWRELKIQLGCPTLEHIFADVLISKSPRLETLQLWLSEGTDALPRGLASSIHRAMGSNLNNLNLRVGRHSNKILSILETTRCRVHHHQLQSLELYYDNANTLNGGYAPMPRFLHSQTLTSLTIRTGSGLTAEEFADIAVECCQLQSFTALVTPPDFESWTEQDLARLQSKEWRLPRLQKLYLRIWYDRKFSLSSRSAANKLVNAFMDYMAVQVGKQTTLQYLLLHRGNYPMSLAGGLSLLGGLKKLRVVDMFCVRWLFRMAEAKFIVDHWHSLIAIRGSCLDMEARDILQRWRPWLEL